MTPNRWNLRLWIEGYRHTRSIWIFVALTGEGFGLIKWLDVFVKKTTTGASDKMVISIEGRIFENSGFI